MRESNPRDGLLLRRSFRLPCQERPFVTQWIAIAGHGPALRARDQPALLQVLEVAPHGLRGDVEAPRQIVHGQDRILL